MLMGMTASLMLLLFVVSLFNPKAEQESVSRESSGVDSTTLLLESTSFDQFLEDANADQILAKLNALKKSKTSRLSPARVTENNQRIDLSKKLLSKKAAPSYKTFAKLDWLSAQQSNYGIDFLGKMNSPHVAEDFKECFARFLHDTDKEVYREAHLSWVNYVLFECIKGRCGPNEISKCLSNVLKKFPEDERVMSTIRVQFKAAIESDVEIAKQLAEDVLRQDDLKDERSTGFMQYVLDSYGLLKVNYDELFINRFVNGDVGLRELEKLSLQLLSNPEAGTLVVNKTAVRRSGKDLSRNG